MRCLELALGDEFLLDGFSERTSMKDSDDVIAKYVKKAITEQLGIDKDVAVEILKTGRDSDYDAEEGLLYNDVAFVVHDSRRVVGSGRVHTVFEVLDERVFEDHTLEGLNLIKVDGKIVSHIDGSGSMTRKDEANLVILKLYDKESEAFFLIRTELSEEELENAIEKLTDLYDITGNDSWTYDEIVEDLEKLGVLEVVDYKMFEIYV